MFKRVCLQGGYLSESELGDNLFSAWKDLPLLKSLEPARVSSPPSAEEVRNMIRKLQEKKAQQRVNDFIEFAAQGKWEYMETMLKNNKVTVDSGNWDSRTALHVAVSW